MGKRGYRHGLVVIAAIGVAACGDAGSNPALTGAERALFGIPWFIDSVVDDGAEVEVGDPLRASVRWEFAVGGGCERAHGCPDGPRLEGRDGCNDFARNVTVDATTIAFGEFFWSTTVACSGPFDDAVNQLMGGATVEYSIEGNRLHLNSIPAGVELTFVAPEGSFGPPATTISSASG
jgi:hypothetical protein